MKRPPVGAERRTALRRIVHEKCKVLVHASAEPGKAPVEGIVTDISAKGMGVSVCWGLPMDKVSIEIQGKNVNGTLRGRVVWCRKLPSTGRVIKVVPLAFRAGIELMAETDEEKQLLVQVLRNL